MSNRLALALGALLLIPLLPSAPAPASSLSTGVAHVGDSFLVTWTWSVWNETIREEWTSAQRSAFTEAPRPGIDGYRQDRVVARLTTWEYDGGWTFGPFHQDIDVDTGDHVGSSYVPFSVPTRVGTPPVVVARERLDPGVARYDDRATLFLALMGKTLAPGDTITRDYRTTGWVPATLQYTGVGWEGDAFRVRVTTIVPGATYHADMWYHQGEAFPVRYYEEDAFEYEGNTWHFAVEGLRSEDVEGTGAAIASSGYVAPSTKVYAGTYPTTTWTVDGPSGPTLSTVPLSAAVAAARAHPPVASWLEARPDAFVGSASFREDPFQGRVRWVVSFANATERYQVTVDAAWVPGKFVGPALVVDWRSATGPSVDRSVVGQSYACLDHARATALAGAPDMGGDDVGVAQLGHVRLDGWDGMTCGITIERILNDNTLSGPRLRESWPYATATVRGDGFVDREGRGTSSVTTGLKDP